MLGRDHINDGICVLRSAGLPGVTVHRGLRIRDSFQPHFHAETHITVILDGARTQRIGRERHQLGPNALLVIPSGEVHSGASHEREGWSFVAIYCGVEALARTVDDLTDAPDLRRRRLSVRVGHDHLGAVRALLGALTESSLAAQTHWLALIGHLLRNGGQPPGGRRDRVVVQRARAFLDEHHTTSPTLDELAAFSGVSKEYLVRSFTADIGLSPHAYHVNLRIERARRMLLGGVSIAEVAVSLGFHDQSHFSRHFRRIVGFPPGHLRRAKTIIG